MMLQEKAANQAKQAIRKAGPGPCPLVGKENHEIQPVKLGGSPTDPANKIPWPREFHRQQVTPWWNRFLRLLQSNGGGMFETLAEFNGNDPATSDSVSECEKALGCRLPEDYISFLRHHNGGEGFIGGESYLILWMIEELIPFNRDYEVAQYCPDLLLIGSSGGGEAYAFDKRVTPWRVVQVPFVGMDYSLCELMGNSFTEFIEKLATKVVDS